MISNLKMRIKKDDFVKVIAGREKGKSGKVLTILKDEGRVIIEGLNMYKKHTKPSDKNRQGGIIEKEGKLSLSNVMLVCTRCNEPTRVSRKLLEDGKKVRVCKACSEVIDN